MKFKIGLLSSTYGGKVGYADGHDKLSFRAWCDFADKKRNGKQDHHTSRWLIAWQSATVQTGQAVKDLCQHMPMKPRF